MERYVKSGRPYDQWPEEDKERFTAGFEPEGLFHRGGHKLLRPTTIDGCRYSYGRYLGFLERENPARLSMPWAARVEPDSIAEFIAHLCVRLTAITAGIHIVRLATAIERMADGGSWLWLRQIGRQIGARGKRSFRVTPLSHELHGFGLRLMDEAIERSNQAGTIEPDAAALFRDGIMIAFLAAVPLRRRTFVSLELNRHLVRAGDSWNVQIPGALVKNGRPLDFRICGRFAEYVDHYVDRFRGSIAGATSHNGLWPSTRGRPMSSSSVYERIGMHTRNQFGYRVSLHGFRYAAGSSWSVYDPKNIQGATDLLGHSSLAVTGLYLGAHTRIAGQKLASVLGNRVRKRRRDRK